MVGIHEDDYGSDLSLRASPKRLEPVPSRWLRKKPRELVRGEKLMIERGIEERVDLRRGERSSNKRSQREGKGIVARKLVLGMAEC